MNSCGCGDRVCNTVKLELTTGLRRVQSLLNNPGVDDVLESLRVVESCFQDALNHIYKKSRG